MIKVQEQSGNKTQLVVEANRSMSWKANLYLAASLGVICMGVALIMASYGLWLVIPFAGAEIILIVACLYLTLRRLSRKEVITVDNDAIRLEWGYNTPDTTVQLPRRWSRISYHCPDSLFEVGSLSVAAHGKKYLLGKCLNRDEKKKLHEELQAALAR
ncbi:MAG: DUF2244 domain-containing protein [Granulosicoccus sp.]